MFVDLRGKIKVLYDINSLTTITDDNPKDFKKGLVIRTLDKYSTDIQILLDTRAIGKIRNNENGRNQIKGMLVDMTKAEYADKGYFDKFTADDIVVKPGTERDSVVVTAGVTVADTVDKIYVTVISL